MVEPRSPLEQARNRTLNRLARRDLSEAEIHQDVKRRFELEEGDILKLLTDLTRMGLVDDARLAKLIQRTLTEQGRGPRWVAMKLKMRGLAAPERTEETREGTERNTRAGRERAVEWVRKRYSGFNDDHKEKARALAALARRGFGYGEASEILAEAKRELESEADAG